MVQNGECLGGWGVCAAVYGDLTMFMGDGGGCGAWLSDLVQLQFFTEKAGGKGVI